MSLALLRVVDRVVPSDLRATLRALPHELAERAQVWRQRAVLFEGDEVYPFRVAFAGLPSRLAHVTDLLRLPGTPETQPMGLGALRLPETTLFCDWPTPGAMKLPVLLRTLIPLKPTVEETVAGLENELRRRVRRLSERAEMVQVTEAEEAKRIHREMMVPFAKFRHDDRADIVPEEELVRTAREDFLGVVALDGKIVAAQSGYSYERDGKRCWAAMRFGYPEAVYSDPRWMSDANTLNAHCALRHAIDSGHEVLDFGASVAAPEGGLLQFKRRRGGFLSTFGCPFSIWFRPPPAGVDVFFWRWPLFSIEPGGLVLHLGVPDGVSDAEVIARLKSIAFGGLEAVRLHARPAIAPELEEAAREIFSSQTGAVHGKGSARRVEVTRVGARAGGAELQQ